MYNVLVFQSCVTGWNGFIYTLNGVGLFGDPDQWTESGPHHTLVLGDGDHVEVKNNVSDTIIIMCYYTTTTTTTITSITTTTIITTTTSK